jgi:hypothetical protein
MVDRPWVPLLLVGAPEKFDEWGLLALRVRYHPFCWGVFTVDLGVGGPLGSSCSGVAVGVRPSSENRCLSRSIAAVRRLLGGGDKAELTTVMDLSPLKKVLSGPGAATVGPLVGETGGGASVDREEVCALSEGTPMGDPSWASPCASVGRRIRVSPPLALFSSAATSSAFRLIFSSRTLA